MSALRIGCSLLLLGATLAAQTSSNEGDLRLGEVPEDLAVANELLPRNNRGAYVARSSLTWSADGRRVAYAGRRGEDWLPVVGSVVGEAYVYASKPIIAGPHVFFHVARNATASTQLSWLWIDGETLGPEDWMGDIAVSPDGKQVAYWTQPGAKVGNAEPATSSDHYLVVASEGKGARWSVTRSERWAACAMTPPLFNDDGQRAFTCALGRTGWVVLQLAGKRETKLSDSFPMIDGIASSGSGAALAYVRSNGSSGGPVVGEATELYFKGQRVARGHDGISMPAVDAGGLHVACAVERKGHKSVAIDDEKKVVGEYDHILELAFDPRCKQLAFIANMGGKTSEQVPGAVEGGQSFVVVRAVAGKTDPIEHLRYLEVRDLVWDPKGERLAYCAREEAGWRVVCGEARSEPHQDVGEPHFAADGASLGFGTRDWRELWWKNLGVK